MFITAADLHMTELKPAYRIESDWIGVCIGKFKQILDEAEKRNCPIIIAGDTLDKSIQTPELINQMMDLIDGHEIFIIPGNHCLRNHNIDLLPKTSIYTLRHAGAEIIEVPSTIEIDKIKIDLFPFGSELEFLGGDVAVIHEFSYQVKPWPDCPSTGNYKSITRRMKGYRLIIAGDNHEDFQARFEKTSFLNCGSMIRTNRNEQDRVPKFYVVHDNLEIEAIRFKVEQEVFDLQAISLITRKDEAIEKVAEQMGSELKLDLDFKKNIQKRIDQGDLEEEIITLIKEIVL